MVIMYRSAYGTKWQWYEMVMVRNDNGTKWLWYEKDFHYGTKWLWYEMTAIPLVGSRVPIELPQCYCDVILPF